MHRILLAIAVVCLAAATAAAQTKISGTYQCDKPDPQLVIPVGDRPDHSLGIGQTKCTWTKPLEIEGAKSKDAVNTGTSDKSGDKVRFRGTHVTTMDSGDKSFAWYQGEAASKDGAMQSKGTWGFTGGSGKLQGIKGKGTFTCSPSGCEVEGEYQLAK
jgi:hypothetical protein